MLLALCCTLRRNYATDANSNYSDNKDTDFYDHARFHCRFFGIIFMIVTSTKMERNEINPAETLCTMTMLILQTKKTPKCPPK
mmetsp:Transcript_20255/g.45920  ORF Transcript_20255/g.45920 Transcript_20255/m.45920 type:complete len:83 (+) Transcript_20255:631-879(+)